MFKQLKMINGFHAELTLASKGGVFSANNNPIPKSNL